MVLRPEPVHQEWGHQSALRDGTGGWRGRQARGRPGFAGGCLLLMAVVLAYYFGVARVSGNFLESAVTGCGLLLGLSAPLFLAASWLAGRRDRRRGRTDRR